MLPSLWPLPSYLLTASSCSGMHRPRGWGSWCARVSPRDRCSPQGSAPGRGGLIRRGSVALHPMVPCCGGPGAGVGVPAHPSGLPHLLAGGPQPSGTRPPNTWRDTRRPLNWWGGTLTSTSTACCGLLLPSWWPSWSSGCWTRTLSCRRPFVLVLGPGGHTPLAHRWAASLHAASGVA